MSEKRATRISPFKNCTTWIDLLKVTTIITVAIIKPKNYSTVHMTNNNNQAGSSCCDDESVLFIPI